jgi:hypothetical protein
MKRQVLLAILQKTYLCERFWPDHGADRNRLRGIEHLHRFVRWQERIDVGLIGDVDALDGMGQDESVDAHHHRHR